MQQLTALQQLLHRVAAPPSRRRKKQRQEFDSEAPEFKPTVREELLSRSYRLNVGSLPAVSEIWDLQSQISSTASAFLAAYQQACA